MADERLIWVVPARQDGRVAFYEEHPDHPEGKAWVADDDASDKPVAPVQIARTAGVNRALGEGRITIVDSPSKPKPKPEPKLEPVLVDAYDTLTQAELKVILKECGLPVYGAKSDLIARLREADFKPEDPAVDAV